MPVDAVPGGNRFRTFGRSFLDARIERISWGAIFAGAVCAIALQALFTLVTIGVGLSLLEHAGGGWSGSVGK